MEACRSDSNESADKLPSYLSDEIKSLLLFSLVYDPEQRPTAQELYAHVVSTMKDDSSLPKRQDGSACLNDDSVTKATAAEKASLEAQLSDAAAAHTWLEAEIAEARKDADEARAAAEAVLQDVQQKAPHVVLAPGVADAARQLDGAHDLTWREEETLTAERVRVGELEAEKAERSKLWKRSDELARQQVNTMRCGRARPSPLSHYRCNPLPRATAGARAARGGRGIEQQCAGRRGRRGRAQRSRGACQ